METRTVNPNTASSVGRSTKGTKAAGRGKDAPHSRTGPQRVSGGYYAVWQTTKVRPWTRKARQRARNKVARASRKANR